MRISTSRQFRQQLYRGHVSLGIFLTLFLYVSIFFGLFAIFMPYLRVWEKPSRHFKTVDILSIDYEPMIDEVLADPDFPRDKILVSLPGYKKDPSVRITHQFSRERVFNPITGQRIHEDRNTDLGMFLNGMHYARPLKKFGLVIFGFLTPGFMFLIAGGLVMVTVLKYRDHGGSQQAVFSKWHRKLFTWTFLPLTLVVVCGSVMGLSLDGGGPMTYFLTKGEFTNIRPVIGPVLFPEEKPLPKLGQPVPMVKIHELLKMAGQVNPGIRFHRLILENWGDKNARIKLEGYNPARPFLNGVTNKPAVVLKGSDGSLISQARVEDRPWSVLLTESIYFLHLLFGVGIIIRLFMFGIMLASGLALGFGVMLWLGKKARRFRGKIPFYHWMGKLSLAVMIGVIPATGLLFILHWLLPLDLPQRLVWQQGVFYNAWLASLAWSFYRINGFQAAREFLTTGGVLFLAAPLCHFMKTGIGPLGLLQGWMPNILCVDLSLFLAGILFLFAGSKLPQDPHSARDFWAKTSI